jgi:predicted HTH domain antitoxin
LIRAWDAYTTSPKTTSTSKGRTKGREEEKRECTVSLLEDKAFTFEKIARLAKVDVEYVEAIAKKRTK